MTIRKNAGPTTSKLLSTGHRTIGSDTPEIRATVGVLYHFLAQHLSVHLKQVLAAYSNRRPKVERCSSAPWTEEFVCHKTIERQRLFETFRRPTKIEARNCITAKTRLTDHSRQCQRIFHSKLVVIKLSAYKRSRW